MTRPKKRRHIRCSPDIKYFKPAGVPVRTLSEICLTADELEAMRLVHMEGLYQENAAESMGISRQTLGRILSRAQSKITSALVGGMAIRIECVENVATENERPDIIEETERRGRHGRRRGGRRDTDSD